MNAKSLLKAAVITASVTTFAGISPALLAGESAITIQIDDQHDAKAIKIIEKHIETLGGHEKISSMQHVHSKGTLSIPQAGLEGTIDVQISSPDKLLITVNLAAMGKSVQGLNGDVAWSSDVMNGPRLLPENEAGDIIQQADTAYLLKFKENNKSISYVGEADFEGQAAHKIQLVDNDDKESTEYYSIESGLLIGSEAVAASPMGEISVITIFGEYKEIDGMMQVGSMVQKMGPTDVVFTFTSFDTDEIDDSVFELPAAVKALVEAQKEKAAP